MKHLFFPGSVLLATSFFALAALPSPPLSGDKPKPTVKLAKSWDAAVEEAKLLNLPIVLHAHGYS